jgi:hypothetical protein
MRASSFLGALVLCGAPAALASPLHVRATPQLTALADASPAQAAAFAELVSAATAAGATVHPSLRPAHVTDADSGALPLALTATKPIGAAERLVSMPLATWITPRTVIESAFGTCWPTHSETTTRGF